MNSKCTRLFGYQLDKPTKRKKPGSKFQKQSSFFFDEIYQMTFTCGFLIVKILLHGIYSKKTYGK